MKHSGKNTETKPVNNEVHKEDTRHHFFRRKSLQVSKHPKPEMAGEMGNLWIKCLKCGEIVYKKEYEKNLKVCQKCRYHARLRWDERVTCFIDEGSWVELDASLSTADPLGFSSEGEIYLDKIKQSQKKTGLKDSLVTGYGTIEGLPIGVAIADFAFMGASMGSAFGEKMVRLIDLCIEKRMPLLTVSASGGARMHEGLFSLMQMAKITTALARLGQSRLPHIALLTDPCYGGVTASFAMQGDMTLAEPGAMIGFAGPRVIEQTTRQKLPAGFQTAEFLQEHGMVDRVVPRRELRSELHTLIKLYGRAKVQERNVIVPMPYLVKNEEMRYVG